MADTAITDRLTPAEVTAELDQLSGSANAIIRALALAAFHARGLRHMGPEDLLQEAFTQLYAGQRSWPRGLSPLRVLGKAMHSIASNARKKADYTLADDLERLAPGCAPLDMPRAEADPARITEAEHELALARRVVLDDREAELLLEVWADGIRGHEAMQELGWDAKRYDATRKRLLRRLKVAATNGSRS